MNLKYMCGKMKKKFMLLTAVLTTFLVLINSLFAIDNITLDHSVNSALTQQKQSEQMSISDVQANTSLIDERRRRALHEHQRRQGSAGRDEDEFRTEGND